MTNEKERREVAKRLREYDASGSPLWFHIAKAFNVPLTMTAREFFDFIADLIEPEPERTCKREKMYDAGGEWYECCSKCRNPFSEHDVFCSKCGAKVVEP